MSAIVELAAVLRDHKHAGAGHGPGCAEDITAALAERGVQLVGLPELIWALEYEPRLSVGEQGSDGASSPLEAAQAAHYLLNRIDEKLGGGSDACARCGHAKSPGHYFGDRLGADGRMHTPCMKSGCACPDYVLPGGAR